jgi:hypothetical protein
VTRCRKLVGTNGSGGNRKTFGVRTNEIDMRFKGRFYGNIDDSQRKSQESEGTVTMKGWIGFCLSRVPRFYISQTSREITVY